MIQPKLLVTVALLAICGVSAACQSATFPHELIGKRLSEVRGEFLQVAPDGDFEDEIDNGITDARWVVIDTSRRYLTLHTHDGVISELLVKDPLFVTGEGIRVGSTFAEVRQAYPDSYFRAGETGASSGILDLVSTSERYEFWFDGTLVRRALAEGGEVRVDSDIVQNLPVWLIRVRPGRTQ